MNNISELRDQRRTVAREMLNLLAVNPGKLWNTACHRQYDSKLADMDRLDAEIARLDVARDRDADSRIDDAIATANGSRRRRDPIIDTYLREGEYGFTREVRNTMSTTTGSQGGFTVESDVASQFVDIMKDYSGVRRVADVIKTEKGNIMPYPTSDGTAEVGEQLVENAAASAQDPSFNTAPLTCWKWSSKIIAVPFELIQDSAIDIQEFVFTRLASRIGRVTNTAFTVGSGSGAPQGFVGVAAAGKVGTTGQTVTIIHDDFVDLVHSVNTAYRQIAKGLAFMMADTSFKVARKLKDSSLRPIYLPSDGASPESIMGYPVVVNDDVPAMAANAKSIFFGNFFTCYKVRDALEVALFRLSDSVYSKLGQVGFLAFARSGGNLVDTNGVRYYQNSAT